MAIDNKRHHFVPVTYLRQFADNNDYLSVARKTNPVITLRSKPTEKGFRNYYYSQPLAEGGRENNALEGVFSTFETDWPQTVSALASEKPANDVLQHLLLFIGLQRVRVPAFRDAIEQSMEAYAWNGFRALKTAGALPPPPPEFPDIAEQVQITIDPHQSIHAMMRVKDELGPLLDSFGYVVLHNRTNVELLTSDNPVAYYLREKTGEEIVPYSWCPKRKRELIFPVSPTILIYGSSEDRERFRRRGLKHVELRDVERVRRLNRTVVRFAYDSVFGKSPVPRALVAKFADSSPVLDPSFAGFHPDDMKLPPYVFGSRRKLPKWDRKRGT